MFFNLLLTDPDNKPDGYGGGVTMENGGWTIIISLIIALVIIISVIIILVFALDKHKKNKTEKSELNNSDLTEEEKQTISDFKNLSPEEKQIISDTIKKFNEPKE